MSYDGNGVFNRLYNWVQDAASGINIMADRMDAEMDGFAQGLSICLTRDGQAAMIADLNMGGFAIVSLVDPTDPQHAATKKYVDKFLPLAGGVVTGELRIAPTSLLTPLVFNTRASDSVVDCAFRNNLNETAKSWVQRVNVTEAAPVFQWRYDNVIAMSLSGLDNSLTLTGPLRLPAGNAERSAIRIPPGAAPATPVNGDVWTTSAGIFARINGVDHNLSIGSAGSGEQTLSAAGLQNVTFGAIPDEATEAVLQFNLNMPASGQFQMTRPNDAAVVLNSTRRVSGTAYTAPVFTTDTFMPIWDSTSAGTIAGTLTFVRNGPGSLWTVVGAARIGNTLVDLFCNISPTGNSLGSLRLRMTAGTFNAGSGTLRWRI